MTADPKDSDTDPTSDSLQPTTPYQELRSLLLQPEHEEIEELKRQLVRHTDVDAQSVAAVLPAAVTLATSKAEQLGQAMAPTMYAPERGRLVSEMGAWQNHRGVGWAGRRGGLFRRVAR